MRDPATTPSDYSMTRLLDDLILPSALAIVAPPSAWVALFLMFEVWFLVPLPKGPVESLLG